MDNSDREPAFSTRIGAAGRLVIPIKLRQALGMQEGRRVELKVHDGVLEVRCAADVLDDLQRTARRHPLKAGEPLLSASLIEDRRKAAKRGD